MPYTCSIIKQQLWHSLRSAYMSALYYMRHYYSEESVVALVADLAPALEVCMYRTRNRDHVSMHIELIIFIIHTVNTVNRDHQASSVPMSSLSSSSN